MLITDIYGTGFRSLYHFCHSEQEMILDRRNNFLKDDVKIYIGGQISGRFPENVISFLKVYQKVFL